MTSTSVADLRNRLAAEFEARGWEYEPVAGQAILDGVVSDGHVDAAAIARRVPRDFLRRQGADQGSLANAIERAIGGWTPDPERTSVPMLTIDNRSYHLGLGVGAQITGGQINVGGTQINVRADTAQEEVLAAVRALVLAGLEGHWNPDAARHLGAVIDDRDDVGFEQVRSAAVDAAETVADPVDDERVRGMLQSISEQGLGGALGTGIAAVAGALIRNPPF